MGNIIHLFIYGLEPNIIYINRFHKKKNNIKKLI